MSPDSTRFQNPWIPKTGHMVLKEAEGHGNREYFPLEKFKFQFFPARKTGVLYT
jgi:hypothetical protein